MSGAAVLVSSAFLKTGGGLLKAFVTRKTAAALNAILPEAITIISEEEGYVSFNERMLNDAAVTVIGPGLANNENTRRLVENIITQSRSQLIVDADGLNCISGNPEILSKAFKPPIICPHPGEFSRLTNFSIDEILSCPLEKARDFAKGYKVVTLLKDARTIIADPRGQVCINTSGNPSLAKAGSGDVLAGIIGGLSAQGADAFTSAAVGAYLHGRAGEVASKELSLYGVNASDIVSYLPRLLKQLQKKRD